MHYESMNLKAPTLLIFQKLVLEMVKDLYKDFVPKWSAS